MSKKNIYSYLDKMIEKTICRIGRAANMLCLEIGKNSNTLESKEIFSLHVQSMWRIMNKDENQILLAASDFYSPSSAFSMEKNFEWDVKGNNLFDEKSQSWIKKVSPIYIKEYKIDRCGDLLISFSDGSHLEIFIDATDDTECWRFFEYGRNGEHLVATGLGIDFE